MLPLDYSHLFVHLVKNLNLLKGLVINYCCFYLKLMTISSPSSLSSLSSQHQPIANPPPKTTGNKEWQEASKEILRAQNANPISGISSKKLEEAKEEEF